MSHGKRHEDMLVGGMCCPIEKDRRCPELEHDNIKYLGDMCCPIEKDRRCPELGHGKI